MTEAEVAPGGVGVPGPRLRSALLVLGGCVPELVVVDAGAREVGILAGRGRVAFADAFVDEVEHERRVDDPDPGGEVLPAVVDERVPAVACPVADLRGDADLRCARLGAGGELVELVVEVVGLAAEDCRDLALVLGAEVLAGVRDLFRGVEHGAVVDPHGVAVLVFDDGAVHECPEVLERLVVQVGAGDPLRDRFGELWCDLVHVGEAVGHRHGDLLAGWALGDAGADRIGERELATQVVRALGRNPEVGADRDDSVGLR